MAVISNGTTLIDNGALDAAVPTGKMILLSTQTASASATISFTSGIDSTYDSYVFKFYNIHPATTNVGLTFNMSIDGGSNYNVAKTTTAFRAINNEADNDTSLAYQSSLDLAQGTGFQGILNYINNDNDSSGVGQLTIYSPSSTTFVKHFISVGNTHSYFSGGYTMNDYVAGYGNTTSAVDAIRFQMSSGNIDSGVIKLYGVA
jgi:hypothetical protein